MKIVFLDIQTMFPNAEDPHWFEDNLNKDYLRNELNELKDITDLADEVVFYLNHGNDDPQTAKIIEDADVVVTNKVILNSSNLNSHIKLIVETGTGLNNIDLEYAKQLGIQVKNCVAYGVNSVVQHTLALILSLTNNVAKSNQEVKDGKWNTSKNFCICSDFFNLELPSSTIGIYGYGAIGQGMAKVAKSLGMNVLISEYKDAKAIRNGRVSFEQMLEESDVITLHCPLTPLTKDLITINEFKKMKKTSYIVNVARGGVINENDLIQALTDKLIAGAATDVLSLEPPTSDNPLIANHFSNLIITPHIAWGSLNARKEIFRQVREHIKRIK